MHIRLSTEALPTGLRLGGFEIERVIASSDFATLYEVRDSGLGCPAVVKEYLPTALAHREGHRIVTRSPTDAQAFEQGQQAFIQEAQMLARCDHPALLRVTRLWQSHGTSYRAMPLYAGRTLRAMRHTMRTPPDELTLRALIDTLLGALDAVHKVGGVHGNVLPENILVRLDGRPVLMDFDAVRRALTSGPEESHKAADDLHALAATVHFCITGQPPSLSGGPDQPLDSLKTAFKRLGATHSDLAYSDTLVNAIDMALQPDPAGWPQNVGEFRAWFADKPRPLSPSLSAFNDLQLAANQPSRARSPSSTTRAMRQAEASASENSSPLDTGADARPTHPPPSAARKPPSKLAPWGVAAGLVGAALFAIVQIQDQHPNDRQLAELTRRVTSMSIKPLSVSPSVPLSLPLAAPLSSPPLARPTTSGESGLRTSLLVPVADRSPPSTAQTTQDPITTSSSTKPVAARNPSTACGKRTQFSMHRCLQSQCAHKRWASHADCRQFVSNKGVGE